MNCAQPVPAQDFDHLLMIDGENLRQGAKKNSVYF
jgi:hypothetical protein